LPGGSKVSRQSSDSVYAGASCFHENPRKKIEIVALWQGRPRDNSGYIYSDEAYSHLTFQVIGSRLKPGCAEGRIVSTAVDLMRRAGESLP